MENDEQDKNSEDENELPPGGPSNVPVENPDKEIPMGDPKKPSQEKTRLKQK